MTRAPPLTHTGSLTRTPPDEAGRREALGLPGLAKGQTATVQIGDLKRRTVGTQPKRAPRRGKPAHFLA